MSEVASVSAKITADVSSFVSGMRTASQAAGTLQAEAQRLNGQNIDANTRPFVAAVDRAKADLNGLQADAARNTPIDANATEFVAAVGKAHRKLDELQADAHKPITIHTRTASTGAAGGAAAGGGMLGGIMGKGMMAAGVAAIAVGTLTSAVSGLAGAAQESVAAQRTTEQIIKATGGAANVTAAQVGSLADSISQKTGIDDEQVQAASNLLLTFKNVKNAGQGQAAMFDRATQAAADLSKAGFGSMDGAAKMLGKALNDPTKGITALSRAGVTFTDSQKKQITAMQKSGDMLGAQALIMKEVESQVGGVAQAAASPMDKLSVMFGNFQEQLGAGLLPVMANLVKVMGPIFNSLAGPLSQVIGILGGAFTQVLAALTPAIGPLVAALAQVAGILGSAIVTALTAAQPFLTTFLTILGQLAAQVGPMLAPLLAKIGQLLSTLLAAVQPLLPVLAQMILNILSGGIPILMVVADALIQVVQAAAPLLAALTPLLPVGTQLIALLGQSLAPILQTLVPYISAVATVLADVLGRAIGVVMMSVAAMILGFSQLAPFVLNNVVLPILSTWADFAAQFFAGAVAAFGWVPGLGDKLQGAQQAVTDFKTHATTAIGDAATTISQKGSDIALSVGMAGQALLQQGPAAQTAGAAMGTSFVTGLSSAGPMSADAAERLSQSAVSGIAATTGPVKQAGSSAASAYATGLQATSGQAVTAATKMGTNAVAGVQSATSAAQTAGQSLGSSAATGMRNAQGEASSAGTTVGNALADGLLTQIEARAPGVASAAYTMGANAAAAVKRGAQTGSPSKITLAVGRGIAQGLTVGMASAARPAISEAARLGLSVSRAVGRSVAGSRSRAVATARLDVADKRDALADARRSVAEAAAALKKARAEGKGVAKAQQDLAAARRQVTRATWDLADAQAAAASAGADFDAQFRTAAIDASRDALQKWKDKAQGVLDFAKGIADAMRDFGKVTSLQVSNGVQPMAGAIVANLRQRLAAVRKFGSNIEKLRQLGLNNAALQDIIAEGPVAGNQYAEALLSDLSSISQVNDLYTQMSTAADALGSTAAQSQYGMTTGQAQSIVNSTVNVQNGAVVLNINGNVSAADRKAITRDINAAVRTAIADLAREVARR